MEDSHSLAVYAEQLVSLTDAAAMNLILHPMLVQMTEETAQARQGFHTEYMDRRAAASRLGGPSEREVFAVRKRGDGVFGGHISVGRTQNLDVAIVRAGISKFHAFFSLDEAGRYHLTDKESKNGTFVGGLRLLPGNAQLVADGDKIGFGGHAFVFMTPATFVPFARGVNSRRANG